MRESKLRAMWEKKEIAFGAWLLIPSTFSAEIVASEGFDYVVVDLQHGMLDFESAVSLLQTISITSATPLARVQANDHAQVMKLLDAGAYGVICPTVNNREECQRFVNACRYPPIGTRGFGPTRALLYGGADYFEHANKTVATIIQIESRDAIENIEDILKVETLDAIYIGSADLALSLGYQPTLEVKEREVADAIDHVLAAALRANVRAGVHCPSGEAVGHWISKGFNFCTLANDRAHLGLTARKDLAAARAHGVSSSSAKK